jgi:hypothetical protein
VQPSVRAFFDQLSFTHRKESARWIEDAKDPPDSPRYPQMGNAIATPCSWPETRLTRLTKTIDELREGRRTH